MPVNPPYSIIDTIARLRAQGGAARGQAFANVGQSLGNGVQSGIDAAGLQKQNDAKAQAAKYHDATMFADKNFDWQHAPPAAAAPQNSILQPAAGGAPPAPSTAAPGYVPAWTKPGAPNSSAPPPAAAKPAGSVTMNDIYVAHGLKPVPSGDHLMGVPKQQGKETLQGEKGDASANAAKIKAAAEKEKSDAANASKEEVARIAAKQRAGSSTTAAEAKKAVANIGAEGKKTVTQAQKDIQSMKNGEMTQEDYQKAKEKSPFYYDLAESLGVIEPPAAKEKPAAKEPEKSDVGDFLKGL